MGTLEKRVVDLERALATVDWEPVEIFIYSEDGSLPGNGEERLIMIIKSGVPEIPGRTYNRGEQETEAAFLKRAGGGI